MKDTVDEVVDSIHHKDFLFRDENGDTHLDMPVTIASGKADDKPSTLRAMLKWLNAYPGQKVLDVDCGSGWTTALLSKLVGHDGKVVAIESAPSRLQLGKENGKKFGMKNVSFHQADEESGWEKEAPYDRILVSSNVDSLPMSLIDQLAPGGKIVVPVVDEIIEIIKDEQGILYRTPHSNLSYVPIMSCAD